MSFWGNYNTSVFERLKCRSQEIEMCNFREIEMCQFRENEISCFGDIKILQFSRD